MNVIECIEDSFSDNPFFFLLFLCVFFVVSVVLIFLLKILFKTKPTSENLENNQLSLNDLIKIAKEDKSNSEDLIFALNYFNKNFKVKNRPSKSFEFFKILLNHKNRSKKLFQIFHKESIEFNKEFKSQLNNIEKEALR